MKSILLISIFLFIFAILKAPGINTITIPKFEGFKKIDKILLAVMKIESGYNHSIVNSSENAVGILQIRPIMVREVNRITGKDRFTLNDRLDSLKSTQMWYIKQQKDNPDYDMRRACNIWNPSGGWKYFEKVKSQMNNLQ